MQEDKKKQQVVDLYADGAFEEWPKRKTPIHDRLMKDTSPCYALFQFLDTASAKELAAYEEEMGLPRMQTETPIWDRLMEDFHRHDMPAMFQALQQFQTTASAEEIAALEEELGRPISSPTLCYDQIIASANAHRDQSEARLEAAAAKRKTDIDFLLEDNLQSKWVD